MARTPDGPPPPPAVQRLRIRYAKRGRLRFTSHRDFARGLRAGAAPRRRAHGVLGRLLPAPEDLLRQRSARPARPARPSTSRSAWPSGATPSGCGLPRRGPAGRPGRRRGRRGRAGARSADRLEASRGGSGCPASTRTTVRRAVESLPGRRRGARRAADQERHPHLRRAGAAVLSAWTSASARRTRRSGRRASRPCAILDVVVRHVTPSVRPDDVLSALRLVADFAPPVPPLVTRLAQGPLDVAAGTVGDPLAPVPT